MACIPYASRFTNKWMKSFAVSRLTRNLKYMAQPPLSMRCCCAPTGLDGRGTVLFGQAGPFLAGAGNDPGNSDCVEPDQVIAEPLKTIGDLTAYAAQSLQIGLLSLWLADGQIQTAGDCNGGNEHQESEDQ